MVIVSLLSQRHTSKKKIDELESNLSKAEGRANQLSTGIHALQTKLDDVRMILNKERDIATLNDKRTLCAENQIVILTQEITS